MPEFFLKNCKLKNSKLPEIRKLFLKIKNSMKSISTSFSRMEPKICRHQNFEDFSVDGKK